MVEVVSPIEDVSGGSSVVVAVLVEFGIREHFAAVAFRRGGGASVAEFFRHGGVVEEVAAGAADGGEEGGRDAVVGDVEGAPVATGAYDGVAGRVKEVDGGDGSGLRGWENGSGLKGLDVLLWDPGETRLGEGLHPRNGFFHYLLH